MVLIVVNQKSWQILLGLLFRLLLYMFLLFLIQLLWLYFWQLQPSLRNLFNCFRTWYKKIFKSSWMFCLPTSACNRNSFIWFCSEASFFDFSKSSSSFILYNIYFIGRVHFPERTQCMCFCFHYKYKFFQYFSSYNYQNVGNSFHLPMVFYIFVYVRHSSYHIHQYLYIFFHVL